MGSSVLDPKIRLVSLGSEARAPRQYVAEPRDA